MVRHQRPRRARRGLAPVAALVVALAGCGAPGSSPDGDELVISAAASLTGVVEELVVALRRDHPDVQVTLNTGGSSSLREQILAGAPVDVFLSARQADADALVAAGLADEPPQLLAHNSLALAVPAGNPAGVAGLSDLAETALLVGLCRIEVPCGEFAASWLAQAGVVPSPDTEEPDVRALLTKLATADLDVGIVYGTDVHGSPDVEVVEVDVPAPITPVVAVLLAGSDHDAARSLLELARSASGQESFARHGFSPP